MPKYAVARGKLVGVYDTYEECLAQVKGFPNAKFKKFNTQEEAEAFINKDSWSKVTLLKQEPLEPENIKPSTSFAIEKISPSNSALNSLNIKVNSLENKLNKFITNTTKCFENLTQRIIAIENKVGIVQSCATTTTTDSGTDIFQNPKKIKLDPDVSNGFVKNKNGFVIVYTDGACSNNGQMGARAGIGVWFNHNHPFNFSGPVKGAPTNNNAEIQAATMAIKQAVKADIKKLILHTDSQFLINCVTQWMHKWKKNDWMLSSGGCVKNRIELQKLDSTMKKIKTIEWKYVPGHKGIIGNEMADKLARKGAEDYKINVTHNEIESDDDDLFVSIDCND